MYYEPKPLWPAHSGPNPAYCGEDKRLGVLASYGLDDLEGDAELTRIVGFAARLCEAPICLVSLVEEERQRFLAKVGLEVDETPRPTSFCAHTMQLDRPMVVPDARLDPRFDDNPLVTGAPHIRFYAGAPLISVEGAPLGALCVIDTKPRPEGLTALQEDGLNVLARAVMQRLMMERQDRAAIEALAKRERELRTMLDSVPGIAWSADADGNFDMFNARWQEVTGAPPPKTFAEWEAFIHPDDFASARADWEAAVEKGPLFTQEWRLRTADGSYRWTLARAIAAGDEVGGERWFGTVIDIDDSHKLSEQRDLLASELAHRIKNIFAVVTGLVTMRARGRAEETRQFAEEIGATIRALGTAHDYVRTKDGKRSENLVGLLHDLLAPYQDGRSERVRIEGEDVAIGPKAATPLALVFHELATNSAKYGALKDGAGTIAIDVRTACKAEDDICIRWREFSPDFVSPGDAPPGFGSRLIRMSVEGQLSGRLERDYGEHGLNVKLVVPAQTMAL